MPNMLYHDDVINDLSDEDIKLLVIKEEVQVHEKIVDGDTIRITKKVNELLETITTSVTTEEIKVEKVAFNKYIDDHPQVRYEGDTMVIPVVREVVVVEKKLLLVEEVRITKHFHTSSEEQIVTLRHDEIIVERVANKNTTN